MHSQKTVQGFVGIVVFATFDDFGDEFMGQFIHSTDKGFFEYIKRQFFYLLLHPQEELSDLDQIRDMPSQKGKQIPKKEFRIKELFKCVFRSKQRSIVYNGFIYIQFEMSEQDLKCPKHGEPITFVCGVGNCKEHRLICQICMQKETLHFSHHANYIYRYKEFMEFNHSKETLGRLDKGIRDCENFIDLHHKCYQQEISLIKDDFNAIKDQFMRLTDNYEQIYVEKFEKEMFRFDEGLQQMKLTFREYEKEKQQQDSFFTKLFDKSKDEGIEGLVSKNAKAFQVRADIINMRNLLNNAKNNKYKYKGADCQKKLFNDLRMYLNQFVTNFYDRFRELLNDGNQNESLRSSIVSETKSLAMSRVSIGFPYEDVRGSSVTERAFRKAQLPELNMKVKAMKERLKPLEIPENFKDKMNFNKKQDGPNLYSTGVYLGQYENLKRQGEGLFVFNDGCSYEGIWQNDNMSVYGRLLKKNCFYEGQIKEGKAHGLGDYHDDYRSYSGEWRNDKRNGIGEQQFKKKKKKYIGAFVEDRYEGKGKLIQEEYTYEGMFKAGQFHEKGKINYRNREVFEGIFHEGQKVQGKHMYPDSSYYEGWFKNGLPDGTGEFYWADGIKYVGQWQNGQQEGIGTQVNFDGCEKKGLWKSGLWQKWL